MKIVTILSFRSHVRDVIQNHGLQLEMSRLAEDRQMLHIYQRQRVEVSALQTRQSERKILHVLARPRVGYAAACSYFATRRDVGGTRVADRPQLHRSRRQARHDGAMHASLTALEEQEKMLEI